MLLFVNITTKQSTHSKCWLFCCNIHC